MLVVLNKCFIFISDKDSTAKKLTLVKTTSMQYTTQRFVFVTKLASSISLKVLQKVTFVKASKTC